uniref:Putative tick transposon n=1 Tax=Rhipicephalus pulchellus TaxID=72859 RepID=L7M1P6_RHIPC
MTSIRPSCLRTLQSLQAQALRTCLGLPRCTSTMGVIAEARRTPIDSYLSCEPLRVYLRLLTRHDRHHLSTIHTHRPDSSLAAAISRHESIIPSGFAPAKVAEVPAWTLSRPEVRLSIPGVGKKSRIPSCGLKQLTLSFISTKYASSTHVFTDGSVLPTTSTAAFVIPSLKTSERFRLDHRTTSTAAEIVAIREVIRYISTKPPRSWTIFCDSKPALQIIYSALRRGPYYLLAQEVAESHDVALKSGHRIGYQWIPGHCGLHGNEQADAEAKMAHDNAAILTIPFSRPDTNAVLYTLLRETTAAYWSLPSHRHRRLHELDPDMQIRLPPTMKRCSTSLLHRLRIGVAFTRRYLHLIGRADSPNCEACGTPETIEHILCVCPRYIVQRNSMATVLMKCTEQQVSEKVLLGPPPRHQRDILKALTKFLRETELDQRL